MSFQVPIYVALIAASGASGRGLLLGTLGATAIMLEQIAIRWNHLIA